MSERGQAADGMPSSIGRYQIHGALGFGAMGAVYRAFDPIIKRPLAIKTIRLDVPRQSPQHRAFIERFYQEARISGTLSHPNIVTLFDIGEESGVPFLAMEYVEGHTIAAMIDSGERFKPERVLGLVSQIAAALDYAHSRGIIHRDIKPSNLIVQEGDRVKVTDFGIAKMVDSEITQSGALLGTPSYMSPEQAMGEKLDGRSDLFSLGVVAFEMLSGQQPFPGTNVTSILYRLVHVDPIEPADLEMNGLVPQKWREVFHKVLAKKPENRYQKAAEFVRDLEYCLGSWFTGLGEETIAVAPAVPEEATQTQPGAAVAAAGLPGTVASGAGTDTRPGSASAEADKTVVLGPEAEHDESATIRLEAPSARGEDTVLMGPPGGGETPSGPTAAVEAKFAETQTVSPVAATERVASRPAPTRVAPLPVGWIVGGAAVLFVLAAAVVGWLLWQRSATRPEPAPSVAVEPAGGEPTDPGLAVPAPATGTLRLASSPPGARVTLGGEDRGQTPLELSDVAFGVHELRVELRGHEPQTSEVVLSAERPVAELEVRLAPRAPREAPRRGTAEFASTPAGATVTVGGRRVGTTPVRGVALDPGRHQVEIALEGHETWSGTVEVEAGRRVRAEASLARVSETRPAPTPPPVDTARVYENRPGDVDRVARKVSGVSPAYPSDRAPRLRSGERVSVTLSILVTEGGSVESVRVEDSAGKLIDDVVVRAVEDWKYSPAAIRGTPVRVRVVFKQTFLGG